MTHLRPQPRPCVLFKPSGESIDVEPVLRYFEGDIRELLGRRREFVAFQEEEEDARLKAGPLVAVDKGMALDDRLHESRGLGEGRRKTLLPSKADLRARHCCLQRSQVAEPWRAPIQRDDVVVEEEDVVHRDRSRAATPHFLESSRSVERYFSLNWRENSAASGLAFTYRPVRADRYVTPPLDFFVFLATCASSDTCPAAAGSSCAGSDDPRRPSGLHGRDLLLRPLQPLVG